MQETANGLHQKVSTQTKVVSLDICYFVTFLRFVAISVPFLGYFGEKSAFWGQISVFWPEVHYEMVYVAYYTALDLHIFNDAKKTSYLSQK